MTYGIPYMGSKNRIAEKIISVLPPAEHFYDLFGGGGAVTHCALISGKYRFVHYNGLDSLVFRGFEMAVNGKFKNESRWISREDFHRLKKTDPYVAFCFSFSNNPKKSYAYSRDREPFKKAVHYSVCFNDNELLEKYLPLKDFEYTSDDPSVRRLELQRYMKNYSDSVKNYANFIDDGYPRVADISKNLEYLERVQSLSELGRTGNLFLTNKSYDELQFQENSVLYCDPPYQGTTGYTTEFSHEKFCDFARKQRNIFISEYSMPSDFIEVACISKPSGMRKNHLTEEKIFTNRNSGLSEW